MCGVCVYDDWHVSIISIRGITNPNLSNVNFERATPMCKSDDDDHINANWVLLIYITRTHTHITHTCRVIRSLSAAAGVWNIICTPTLQQSDNCFSSQVCRTNLVWHEVIVKWWRQREGTPLNDGEVVVEVGSNEEHGLWLRRSNRCESDSIVIWFGRKVKQFSSAASTSKLTTPVSSPLPNRRFRPQPFAKGILRKKWVFRFRELHHHSIASTKCWRRKFQHRIIFFLWSVSSIMWRKL